VVDHYLQGYVSFAPNKSKKIAKDNETGVEKYSHTWRI
jgi:hypothetical protein